MAPAERWTGPSERASAWALATLALLAVGVADHVTGSELGFYVFYFIPVAAIAWRLGLHRAAVMALAASAVWYAVDSLSARSYSSEWLRLWNTLVRLASFLVIGVTLARVRGLLDREVELNAALNQTLAEVRQLSGLLPICASCKRIRNDEGYWERVEKYVADRSQADFTHSICPTCEAALYPDDGEPGDDASDPAGIRRSSPR